MNVSGFGYFVPFGEIPVGTLFLDQASGPVDDSAILMKVFDPEQRLNCLRLYDRALIEKGFQMPTATARLPPEKPVLTLPEYGIEIENSIGNVVWESDVAFSRAVVLTNGSGELAIKAYRNRNKDDYDFLLFHLASGDPAGLGTASVGFRRWSVVRHTIHGERCEIFRFDP